MSREVEGSRVAPAVTPSAISNRGRNALVLGGLGLVWLALDQLTKSWLAGSYAMGEVITGPLLGLIRLHLVHNTGAAWGMFGDSTFLLGCLSLVVCVGLSVYLLAFAPRASLMEAAGVALVVAGGLGNAIDRFTMGYVVDFIEPVFIDFPVFNIADIGVTCGFVIFLLGLLLRERREGRMLAAQAAADARAEAIGNGEAAGSDGPARGTADDGEHRGR